MQIFIPKPSVSIIQLVSKVPDYKQQLTGICTNVTASLHCNLDNAFHDRNKTHNVL